MEFIPPDGYDFSPQDRGGNDAADSDANPQTGRTAVMNLAAGEHDMTWDAGLMPLADIGDRVWIDENKNGAQDAGEPGVPDVTVHLYNEDGTLARTTTTDANGNYLFEDVPPGNYYVEFVLPDGYELTTPDNGDNDSDSDAAPNSGRTVILTMAGVDDLTWDAGLFRPEKEPGAKPEATPTPTPTPTLTPKTTPNPDATPTPAMTPTPGTTDVAALRIEKSADRSSTARGGIVQYTVIVSNDSDEPVFGVTVQDTLPQGFSYHSGSATLDGGSAGDPAQRGSALTFTIGRIPANGAVTLTYVATVALDANDGRYENVAVIVGGGEATAAVQVSGDLSGGVRFGKRREEISMRKPCVVIPAEIGKPWFVTDMAMYAASELYDASQPFILWSESHGLTVDQQFLAPTGVREFGAEALQFSQENISTVLMNSGIGLHLKYAPFIAAGAQAKNLSAESYLDERLRAFAQRSNLKIAPRNIFPIFVEYAAGDPRYTRLKDVNNWETLLWETGSFDTDIVPSALGQTLRRQALLLEDALAANHDENGARRGDGAFVGVDDARGFIGLLTAESVVNKLFVMANALLRDAKTDAGEPVRYFPYRLTVAPSTLADAQPVVDIADGRSRLFDQLSLLWGLSDVMLLMERDGAARAIFTQDALAPDVDWASLPQRFDVKLTGLTPESVHALAKRLAEIVFETMRTLHYDGAARTLIDEAWPNAGDAQDRASRKEISTMTLGLAVTALARYHAAQHGDAQAQAAILSLTRAAADYLADELRDQEHGGFFAGKRLDGENSGGRTKSLQAQMAGIRGLLAAFDLTNDERYRAAAFAAYKFAENALWNGDLEVYKDREKRGLYAYTPLDLGATVGALRELIYHSGDARQTLEMMTRMKAFVKQIAKHAGLQLSQALTGSAEYLIPEDNVSAIRTAQVFDSPFGLAPVLAAEIALNSDAIAALRAKRPTDSCEQARNAMRSVYYYTDLGMYAASEFALKAVEPAGTRPAAGERIGERNRNPELLNLGALERTARQAADFSDYNLAHLQTKSALGVALKYAPLIQKQAQAAGVSADEYVKTLLAQYAELSGLKAIPANLLPIFLEFEGGVPEIEYGKGSERWLDGNMDKSLIPSALGQTLRRQALWLKDALAVRHDAQNRAAANGAYIGRNAEEGFLALLIAQEAANKVAFLRDALRVKLEAEGASTPSGSYFPHRVEVDFDGDEPKRYDVEDRSSVLFDQTSLLWGLSEFYGLMANAPQAELFGDGKLISGDFRRMTGELITLLLDNLEALHWNAAHQTFYEVRALDGAADAPNAQAISTEQIALAAIALESVWNNADDAAARERAKTLLLRQVAFLRRHLFRQEDGAVLNGASLTEDGVTPLRGLKTLAAHAGAARTFLIAFRLTGDPAYLTAAKRSFETLDRTFWDARLEVYRSAIGQYQYTPFNVALTVGAFRELLSADRADALASLNEHFAKFFDSVVARVGLQLSEQQYFLERAGSARTLAPVFASDLMIQPDGSAADVDVPQPGSTLLYVIRVTEASLPCGADDAYIEDALPENVTFVKSVPAPESLDDRLLRWRVADVTPDENGVYAIYVEARVNANAMSQSLGLDARDVTTGRSAWKMRNCATLWCSSPQTGDQQVESDCAEDEIKQPQLGVEKSLRLPEAEPGNAAEFEVVVTNFSDVTAYTLVIEDANPAGFVYVKDSVRSPDAAGVTLDDTDPLVWVLEDLEPKKSARLTYKAMVDPKMAEGAYRTTVKVHALDRSGAAFESNEFAVDVNVKRAVFLDVAQQLGEQDRKTLRIQAGTVFPIETKIENVGSAGVMDVAVLVTLPQGARYAPGTSRINQTQIGEPDAQGNALIWKIGDMPTSVSKTLAFELTSERPLTEQDEIVTTLRGVMESGQAYDSKAYRLKLLKK